MTDTTTFPFEGATALDDAVAQGSDRRKLLLLGGAGVLLAALVGYFLILPMFGGDPAVTDAAPLVRHRAPVVAATPTPRAVPKTFAGVVGRDPFKPLVTPPVAATASTGGTSTTTTPTGTSSTSTTSTSTTGSGTTSTTTTTTPSTAPSATPSPATVTPPATTAGMVNFKLLSVTGGAANVSVDGKAYTWTVGKTYLNSYKLLKTGANGEGFFLYGDMPIHISEGQTFIFGK